MLLRTSGVPTLRQRGKRGARLALRLARRCIHGTYEIPMMSPSPVCNRTTLWPHGSVRGGCKRMYPLDVSSEAALETLPGLLTSNSMNI